MPYLLRGARLVGVACGLGLLASACYEDPGVISGEVSSTNKFRYVCDQSVAVEECSGRGTAVEFPAVVAKGALFRLAIDNVTASEVTELRPISDEVVGTHADGGWVCGTDGLAGFVAFNRAGEVVDYVHIPIETPNRLDFVRPGSPGTFFGPRQAPEVNLISVTIAVGEELPIAVRPLGRSNQAMAGALPYTWSTSGGGVARVTGLGTPTTSPSARATIKGEARGKTRVLVEGAGLKAELVVTVQ